VTTTEACEELVEMAEERVAMARRNKATRSGWLLRHDRREAEACAMGALALSKLGPWEPDEKLAARLDAIRHALNLRA
jgi:hypothetical protein